LAVASPRGSPFKCSSLGLRIFFFFSPPFAVIFALRLTQPYDCSPPTWLQFPLFIPPYAASSVVPFLVSKCYPFFLIDLFVTHPLLVVNFPLALSIHTFNSVSPLRLFPIPLCTLSFVFHALFLFSLSAPFSVAPLLPRFIICIFYVKLFGHLSRLVSFPFPPILSLFFLPLLRIYVCVLFYSLNPHTFPPFLTLRDAHSGLIFFGGFFLYGSRLNRHSFVLRVHVFSGDFIFIVFCVVFSSLSSLPPPLFRPPPFL